MGEMAEYYLEQHLYGQEGGGIWDDPDLDYCCPAPRQPRCMYCGSKDVYWTYNDDKYRLYNTMGHKPHTCKEYFDYRNKKKTNK